MGTVIRSEVSKKNMYWIEKHRYYELKHFCQEYSFWEKQIGEYNLYGERTYCKIKQHYNGWHADPTFDAAEQIGQYRSNMNLIKTTAKEVDPIIGDYIFKGVTEGLGYNVLNPPCAHKCYYNLYRKFFFLLDRARR